MTVRTDKALAVEQVAWLMSHREYCLKMVAVDKPWMIEYWRDRAKTMATALEQGRMP